MSKQSRTIRPPKGGVGQSFSDTKPMGMNPKKAHFEPTTASPIRQRKHMAGVR